MLPFIRMIRCKDDETQHPRFLWYMYLKLAAAGIIGLLRINETLQRIKWVISYQYIRHTEIQWQLSILHQHNYYYWYTRDYFQNYFIRCQSFFCGCTSKLCKDGSGRPGTHPPTCPPYTKHDETAHNANNIVTFNDVIPFCRYKTCIPTMVYIALVHRSDIMFLNEHHRPNMINSSQRRSLNAFHKTTLTTASLA